MTSSELKNIDKIISYGVISYNRIKYGINKTIKCPICGHKHLLENDICPQCKFELNYTSDILFPNELSCANFDLTPNEYKELYKSGLNPKEIRERGAERHVKM